MFSLWKTYDTEEETFDVYNSAAYTTCAHETMHAMGFAHIDNHKSIMNTYVSLSSPKDFTEFDKKIIDQYNVIFYGSKSKQIQSENSTKIENEMGL